jgi:hypothetical protein
MQFDIQEVLLSAPDGATLAQILESVPDSRKQIVQTWMDGLKAQKWSWDPESKSRVYEPDHKERRENAKLLAAYLEGLPTETTIVKVAPGADGDVGGRELRQAVKSSPAVRAALRAMIDDAESQPVETKRIS